MDKINILVLGNGGREHAFCWKLAKSQLTNQLFIAPGNGGTEDLAINLDIVVNDFGAIKNDVLTAGPAGEGPDLFVGPHDMVGEIVANGAVAPIDLGSIASDIFDVGITAFSYGGDVYGFPYATEAIAMYYNADLVDGVPSTWEEVKAACDAAGTELCVGAPGGGGGGDAYHNIPFVQSDGGYICLLYTSPSPRDRG